MLIYMYVVLHNKVGNKFSDTRTELKVLVSVRVKMKVSSANLRALAANFLNKYCSSSRNNPSSCKVNAFQHMNKIK